LGDVAKLIIKRFYMKRTFVKSLVCIVPMLLLTLATMAQGVVKGKVIDSQTKEELIGATVMVQGTGEGAATNLDGSFVLETAKMGDQVLIFRCVGYKELRKEVKITAKPLNLGIIKMETESIGLGDVTVTASVAVRRKTPVAISVIEPVEIENKLSTQEFPEILKSTPGVYATKSGGAFGDSRINLRGFEQANIAVMINGVPMNDMEWGGLYWSNWAGLSDVTRSMQVQRGLGASKVSSPSVGGSINIVTRTTDAKEGGSISYALGNDGYNKIMFNVSTGLRKGWAITLLGAKSWGDGYIQGTEFESYSYFANISKQINSSHLLSFTVFGAPQWHNQRSNYDGLTIEGWQKVEKYMGKDRQYRYNPTYGFGLHGERKTSSYNRYHKPQISLNHFWTINEKSSLSTVLYVSIGRGGGYKGLGSTSDYANQWYGSSNGTLNTYFRNADGTFAYDKIYELNASSENGSLMAMSNSVNEHNWYGLMSTYTTSIGKYFDVYGGIDFRYYNGTHTNKLVDLYGGDFFIDRYRAQVSPDNNANANNPDWVNQKLKVGDVVYRDYDGYVMQEGIFGQAEFNREALSVFVAGAVSNTSYWQKNHFYYDKDHEKSSTENFIGWNVKGGANYNLTDNHNVFANIGYISRAPFYSGGVFLYALNSNATNPDAVNEKVFSLEVGYGFRSSLFSANLNLYRTEWLDKTMTRTMDITLPDGTKDRSSINMSGVNALHQGIELDFVFRPIKNLDINGMLSVGDWKWNSVSTGYFYNSSGQPLKDNKGNIASGIQAEDHAKMVLDLDGTRVGNSAQTTFALGAKYQPLKGLRVGADYTYWMRNYANFSVGGSNGSDLIMGGYKAYETPWRMPSAGELDMNVNYSFYIGKIRATLFGNVNNILDNKSISDATDGANHDWKTAYQVFYRFGRNYSIRLKIAF